jgi:hypothetical protein
MKVVGMIVVRMRLMGVAQTGIDNVPRAGATQPRAGENDNPGDDRAEQRQKNECLIHA